MRNLLTRRVNTDVLDVTYHEAGPAGGEPVILLHGFPYDIHSYVEVAPLLAESGYRVIVPYLRGHGPTRFLRPDTARSALGADVIALMDALAIPQAVLAGYDWGGRAACVAAALRPERVTGLVSSSTVRWAVHCSCCPSSCNRCPATRRCRPESRCFQSRPSCFCYQPVPVPSPPGSDRDCK